MISIVICSRNIDLYEKIQQSINHTIGDVVYEIIKFDNSQLNEAITKVYNKGIELAKHEFILFVHEDVLFQTLNWGEILTAIFNQNSNLGLLGIAGSKYKSRYPSAFWHTKEDMLFINLIQHYRNKKPQIHNQGFKDFNLEKVVVLDGVFLTLRKSTNVRFNEEIGGFHCYDLGISIDMIESKYDVCVTNQILIEHFSIGNTNLDFVKGVIKFHKLYKNKLPQYINKDYPSLETEALKRFLGVCLENRFIPFKYWFQYLIKKPFNRLNLNLFKLMLFKIKSSFK